MKTGNENEIELLRKQILDGKTYNGLLPELTQRSKLATVLTDRYNDSYGKDIELREGILRELMCQIGNNVHFEQTFRCEFGFNIIIGNNFFANYDCIMLDANLITIGDNVLLGPRVGLYTTNHATHPIDRAAGDCYARPITIEDNVWIGAGVHIMGGVNIGKNSIIGAGSVITKDIPSNVIAAGVPCKIIHEITEEDRNS